MALVTKVAHVSSYVSNQVSCCTAHSQDYWASGTINVVSSSKCNPSAKTFDIVLANTSGIANGAKLYIEYDDSGTNASKPVTKVTKVPAPALQAAAFSVRGLIDASLSLTDDYDDQRVHKLRWLPRLRVEWKLVLFERLRFGTIAGRLSPEEQLAGETAGIVELSGAEKQPSPLADSKQFDLETGVRKSSTG